MLILALKLPVSTTTGRTTEISRGEQWEPSVLDVEPASRERSNVTNRDQIAADALKQECKWFFCCTISVAMTTILLRMVLEPVVIDDLEYDRTKCLLHDLSDCTFLPQRLRFVNENPRIRRSMTVCQAQLDEAATISRSIHRPYHIRGHPTPPETAISSNVSQSMSLISFKDDIFMSFLASKLLGAGSVGNNQHSPLW